jgi:predicted MPP superfamily phosphohydrolase
MVMAERSTIGLIIGFLSKLVLFVVLLAAGVGVWSVMHEPGELRYTQMKIASAQWPQHWQPIRVVVVSDLHVGSPYVDLDRLETVVARINDAEPDIVMLLGSFMPGDFFANPVSPRDFAPVLGGIKAKYSVLALLGRRDMQDGGKLLTAELKKAKITVLSDSVVSIKLAQKKRLSVVGFSDEPSNYPRVMAGLPKGDPAFGMVHNPARFKAIPPKVDIVFAGFTHGGLVNIPEFPLPVMPSGVPGKYAYGLIEENQHQMFVTGGIGTDEYPIRLNNMPEILVATIVAK